MTKQRYLVAVYIDLENVSGILSLKDLFELAILEDSDAGRPDVAQRELAFVIKEAYGRSESINPLRRELAHFNFDIHETPHLTSREFKNRADLMISISAFETVYLNNPEIDVYLFVTNDSDFSVIMDKLRKYGKEVWLCTRDTDISRKIFNNSCDRIFAFERVARKEEELVKRDEEKARSRTPTKRADENGEATDEDKTALSMIAHVLSSVDAGSWITSAAIGSKFNQIDRSFQKKKTRFGGIEPMLDYLAEKGVIELGQSDKGHPQARVKSIEKLKEYIIAPTSH